MTVAFLVSALVFGAFVLVEVVILKLPLTMNGLVTAFIFGGAVGLLIGAVYIQQKEQERSLREVNDRLSQEIAMRTSVERELEQHRNQLAEMITIRTAELEQANSQLRVLTRAKDEFVSNVSHELKTPITTIKLYHELLRGTPEKLEKYIGNLQRETSRLEQLVEGLLQLSRLDQGAVRVNMKPVDLFEIVQTCRDDREPVINQAGLVVNLENQEDIPAVRADPVLLGQVVSILFTNALNYTPAGGVVTISTKTRQENGNYWCGLSVSDTGPGVNPDDAKRLFERFYRGQVGVESNQAGTGLGLAIAKEIIDRHNGQIELTSTGVPGEGASFTLWLPVDPPLA